MSVLSRRQGLAGAVAAALRPAQAACGLPAAASAGAPLKAYADPGLLARLPFGSRSHWLQPWRAVAETVPAATLAQSIGAVVEDVTQSKNPAAVETLARHGIRLLRLEIGWGEVDFSTETRLLNEGSVRRLLFACRRARIRPLILLNAHHGQPTPFQRTEVRLVNPVAAGDRSVLVTATAGIVPNRTGITDPVKNVMADLLVTRVEAGYLHLSKPFPRSLPAGSALELATLRYEPFSTPGTERNEATIAGWLRYVDLVAGLAGTLLDPDGSADRGFDLEVWNELTFGSQFLSINNYYDPKPLEAREQQEAIWAELPARTAALMAANPARYAGVALTNGFASTIPWVASSRQHPRVSAISKHPYPPVKQFPRDEETRLVALGPDAQPTRFVPSYAAFFPEYGATAIQTETLLRDVIDTPNEIYGVAHGRLARRVDGRPAPVDVWLTEIGVNPREVGVTDRQASERLKTKFYLRAGLFFAGIGVARTYLFNAIGPVAEFGLIDAVLPSASTPALRALARAIELICGPDETGPSRVPVRRLAFSVQPTAAEGGTIFAGDEASGMAPLRASDCLVLLPFQRASGCMAVVYYIMTRDVRADWPPERLRVQIEGLAAAGPVQAFDPIAGRDAPCLTVERGRGRILLDLEVTDTPRILTIQCDGSA